VPGRLSINSRPWAYVYIDGALRGETPLQELEISPGVHQLRLVNPGLKRSRTLKLQVRPGEQIRKAVELR
jgi:hypothetical protein